MEEKLKALLKEVQNESIEVSGILYLPRDKYGLCQLCDDKTAKYIHKNMPRFKQELSSKIMPGGKYINDRFGWEIRLAQPRIEWLEQEILKLIENDGITTSSN